MRRALAAVALPLLAVPGLAVAAMLMAALSSPVATATTPGGLDCQLPPGPGGGVGGLSAEQVGNARVIVEVGASLGVPQRGWVVGIATARQESGLRAGLTEAQSDRDSAGLFQQRRPWAPGGSEAWRMDPVNATTAFYTGGAGGQRGLLDIPGWQTMTVAQAAQAVQVSAFPDAYARWETLAVSLVAALAGDADPQCEPPPGDGVWQLPLPAGTYRLSSPFGMRVHPVTGVYKLHDGADFAASCGTPVLAAAAGTAVVTATSAYGPAYVTIRHADGVETSYGHMESSTLTGQRQPVAAGQRIGAVGTEGYSTGCHLHFIVRIDNQPTDPLPWLRQHGAKP